METDKLRVFITIAKTESIRKAAEILNLTPSAVSKIYHKVEKDVGETLLTPSGRGLKLTTEGRFLAERAEKLIAELDDLKVFIKNTSLEKREAPLRIATFEVFSTYFLQVLGEGGLDNRKIVLHESLPGDLERQVATEKVDLGITFNPTPFPDVEHLRITRIEMGTFRKKATFEGLPIEELPYVVPAMPTQGMPSRNQGLDGWPLNAFTRKVAHEVTLMESALELCRQGRCAGYFPTFIIQFHNKKYRPEYSLIRHIPTPHDSCYTDVYIAKRKDAGESRDVKLVAKLLRLGTKVAPGFTGRV